MRRVTLGVLALPTLLLAGCGGSSNDATTSSSAVATTVASTTSAATTPSSASASATSFASTSSSAPSNTSSKSSGSVAYNPSATTVAKPTTNSTPSSVPGTPGKGCVPTKVAVPAVGIVEPIRAMGVNAQGQIYPPAHTTMWYDRSPQPGANGVSVIAGHVEYDGPDDFYNLDRVPVGSSVTVNCSNGRVLRWTVSHKESVLKTKLQTDQRVWGGSASPVVALITCDRNSKVVSGHHLNNYVVWVRPA
ncbi:class F sortase [Calidifontibacter terrae]